MPSLCTVARRFGEAARCRHVFRLQLQPPTYEAHCLHCGFSCLASCVTPPGEGLAYTIVVTPSSNLVPVAYLGSLWAYDPPVVMGLMPPSLPAVSPPEGRVVTVGLCVTLAAACGSIGLTRSCVVCPPSGAGRQLWWWLGKPLNRPCGHLALCRGDVE